MTTKRSTAQMSADALALLAYVEAQKPGGDLFYAVVEDATGVQMDQKGRAKLRRAIIASGKEYVVFPDVGYQLGDAKSAEAIVVHRVASVTHRVKRARRAAEIVAEQFGEEMKPDQRQRVVAVSIQLNIIAHATEEVNRVYTPTVKKRGSTGIHIDVEV